MRKFLIFVAVVACVIGGIVAINYFGPHTYLGICTDKKTHVRLPDKDCQPPTNTDDWTFYDANTDIPAVGQEADDGAADPPEEDQIKRGGVPPQGQQPNVDNEIDDHLEPGGGAGGDDEVGVNSGDEGGENENVGSGGGGEDGE